MQKVDMCLEGRPGGVLFMQITTSSTCKTKPNLQLKAKKTVCLKTNRKHDVNGRKLYF